jgi:integrase
VRDAAAKRAIERMSTRLDGKTPVAQSSFRRRRAALSKLFTYAISLELIAGSPLTRLRRGAKSAPATITPIDAMEVVGPREVLELIGFVAGAHYRLLLFIMFYAGLRPSEADGLRVMDCYLPADGRGVLTVRRSTTEGRKRYSAQGTNRETGPLKHRPVGKTRQVPIPTVLKDMLIEAVAGKGLDELVVTTRTGTPIAGSNRARIYKAARARWAAAQPVRPSAVTMPLPYSLRHACATLWLQAMPPEAVAARCGNSVPVLLATYANVLPARGEHYNAAVDEALDV